MQQYSTTKFYDLNVLPKLFFFFYPKNLTLIIKSALRNTDLPKSIVMLMIWQWDDIFSVLLTSECHL